jgi:hypothetical protein
MVHSLFLFGLMQLFNLLATVSDQGVEAGYRAGSKPLGRIASKDSQPAEYFDTSSIVQLTN